VVQGGGEKKGKKKKRGKRKSFRLSPAPTGSKRSKIFVKVEEGRRGGEKREKSQFMITSSYSDLPVAQRTTLLIAIERKRKSPLENRQFAISSDYAKGGKKEKKKKKKGGADTTLQRAEKRFSFPMVG